MKSGFAELGIDAPAVGSIRGGSGWDAVESDLRIAQLVLSIGDDYDRNALLEILFRAGFENVCSTSRFEELPEVCLWKEPDLIVADSHLALTGENGDRSIVHEMFWTDAVPTLAVLGAFAAPDAEREVLMAGARDILRCPFDPDQVIPRVRGQLEVRLLLRQMRARTEWLDARLRERDGDLNRERADAVARLTRAAGFRDSNTAVHSDDVGILAAKIADALGLDIGFVDCIASAAALHDIGKIATPDAVLLKKGALTAEEWEAMRMHTTVGAAILAGGDSEFLRMAEIIARTHHERWDGSGYGGLVGEQIPLEGRIVAIADVFDALTSDRPYRKGWTINATMEYILERSGTLFDPVVTRAFAAVIAGGGLWVPV